MNKPFFSAKPIKVLAILLMLFGSQGTLTHPGLAASDLTIYSDTLNPGWQDWSWAATYDYNNAAPVHSGLASISVTYTAGYAGLYLHADAALPANEYTAIQFWVHGGSTGGQSLNFNLNDGKGGYPFTVPANVWTQVTVPLLALGNPATLSALVWQDASSAVQPTFYLDDISLIGRSSPNGWLVLNGTDKYVLAPFQSELDLRGGSFTVEMWVKFTDAILGTGTYGIWPITQSYNFYFHIQRILGGSGYEYCNVFTLYGNVSGCSFISPDIGTLLGNHWGHLAGVYDQAAGETRIYWNGTLLNKNNQTPGGHEPGYLAINYGGDNFIESADEIRISDSVRYSGSSFTIPSAPFACDANTLALWHFDEIEGSTIFHDACGAQDNFLTGNNGAHTEGVNGHWVYLPLVAR